MAKVEQTKSQPKSRTKSKVVTPKAKLELSVDEILGDYRLAHQSRIASLMGRKEVLSGKAKFGIFGDGKEVAQLAMAKAFRRGDWRSGYYRDQTFMFAKEMCSLREMWAQLYANTDLDEEPASGGRQMVNHFATRYLDAAGNWKTQVDLMNSSADVSPTAGHMARSLGLAYASKLYRQEPMKNVSGGYSNDGSEVVFATIGNASTSEGLFFETVNAAGVLQVPLIVSVWDDGYGISVPNELQTTHSSISEALAGMQWNSKTGSGLDVYVVKGWDYVALCDAYLQAADKARRDHVPSLIHVTEMTQPGGHSTSGSQERYKSEDRLRWEAETDCILKMRQWILAEELATAQTLDALEAEDKELVESARRESWKAYMEPIRAERNEALNLLRKAASEATSAEMAEIVSQLEEPPELNRKQITASLFKASVALRNSDSETKESLVSYLAEYQNKNNERYNSHLYSESPDSPLEIEFKAPTYSETSEVVDGRIVLLRCFDHNLKRDSRIFVVGEDVGKLGDVNLVFEGLHAKYGDLRVTDTGIREATILGQGIGAAMRGLRPIVDIQYLDYLMYALQGASDDLATLHYRTAGGQKAPVIIRTKGHRLQGIWHTGSPMGVILHACRGIYLCVPRDMTRAAGMYNTIFRSDNPAILIEVLSGYRIKERVPDNVGTFTLPLGEPEVLRPGTDVTVVTYGASCRLAMEAAGDLEKVGIDPEIIDVQTLNPFDHHGSIVSSLEKTGAVMFLDEDVPGGASAFMMQEVLENQDGWHFLDAAPRTLAASPNRSAYATDGDYFTKPNRESIFEAVYEIMRERRPREFPSLH